VSKPLAIDLCHGSGGWTDGFIAEGYRVIGVDVNAIDGYLGEHVTGDVRVLLSDLRQRRCDRILEEMASAAVIVASPSCEEFSRHQMPWTRARNPPQPDQSTWKACVDIAVVLGLPIVLENVRMAQHWMGRAAWHAGSFYLWGNVPALMPKVTHRAKESYSSKDRLKRARVPLELARWIAKCFYPADSAGTSSIPVAENTDAQIATETGYSRRIWVAL